MESTGIELESNDGEYDDGGEGHVGEKGESYGHGENDGDEDCSASDCGAEEDDGDAGNGRD